MLVIAAEVQQATAGVSGEYCNFLLPTGKKSSR